MAATNSHICVDSQAYYGAEIINIITSASGLLITVLIIIHASINLPKQTKMENFFKFLFWLTASLAILTLTFDILSTTFCVENIAKPSLISTVISLSSYLFLLLVLLTTLLTRLKITFDGSVYEISKHKKCGLFLLYLVSMSLAISAICLFTIRVYRSYNIKDWIDSTESIQFNRASLITGSLSGAFYIITAVWAVYIFSQNLMNVAILTSSTDIDYDGDIELNKTQIKMIDSIARYVALFTVSSITSLLAVIILSAGKWWPGSDYRHGQIYMIISGIDTVVNLLCCYLQYSFNIKYYEKYCGCLGCWTPYFKKRMKHNMQKKHLERKNQLQPLKTSTDDTQQDIIES